MNLSDGVDINVLYSLIIFYCLRELIPLLIYANFLICFAVFLFSAAYEIADKKANKFTKTSDLSSVTTEAETEVCSNTKRIRRPPASYSPELPGNSRVQQKIRSVAKKSKTPSALQQLPTIPPGLALSRSPERSISSLVTETNQENDAGFGLANEENENSDRESQFSSSLISQTTPSTSSMLVAHRESG